MKILSICLASAFFAAGYAATVTNLHDSGVGSLRQAILDSQGNETITFAVSGTILLKSELPEISVPNLIIDGRDKICIDGSCSDTSNGFRPFFISSTGAQINNLSICSTNARGVNGASASGGGSGLGGGVFINNSGAATISNVKFSSIHATGGAGGCASSIGSTVTTGAGGGGSAIGGVVFIESGGALTLSNCCVPKADLTPGEGGSGNTASAKGSSGSVSSSGIYAHDGTLVLSSTKSNSISGEIGGGASVTKSGSGEVQLLTLNSYTGTTTVSAGTLTIFPSGDIRSTSGVIVNNGALKVCDELSNLPDIPKRKVNEKGTFDLCLSAAKHLDITPFEGVGTLKKSGPATLSIDAPFTHTGPTIVSEGIMLLSNGHKKGSIEKSRAVTIEGGATLQCNCHAKLQNISGSGRLCTFNQSKFQLHNLEDTTFDGVCDGSKADLTKTGRAKLYLSNDHKYTGKTLVLEGVLAVAGSIEETSDVSISSGATLNFCPQNKQVFSKSIQGNGDLLKTGTGATTLSGINTYRGATTVREGKFVVNGLISHESTTTVFPGAMLKGKGCIGPAIIQGMLQPGNSIGTIEVVGNYTQEAGSTLSIEISPTTASKVNITGGSATIEGGATLQILPQSGSYSDTSYVILEADGGVTGTFDTVSINTQYFAGTLTPQILYEPTQVQILLSGLLTELNSAGEPLTGDTALLALTSDLVSRINRSQMGLVTTVQDQRYLQNELCCFTPQNCYEPTDKKKLGKQEKSKPYKTERKICDRREFYHPYVVFDYSRADVRKRKYMLPGKDYIRAVIAGCDFRFMEDFVVGAGLGYTNGWGTADNSQGKVSSNGFSIASYFQARAILDFFIDGAINFGKSFYKTRRSQSGEYTGSFHGYDFSSQLRFLYQSYFTKVSYRPYLSMTYFVQQTGNYNEQSTGNNRLAVGKDHYDFLELEFGVAFWAPFRVRCWTLAPQLSFAYVKGYIRKPHDVPVSFVTNFNGDGSVRVANITAKQWKVVTGFSAHTSHCTELFVTYEALFDEAYSNYQQGKIGFQRGF